MAPGIDGISRFSRANELCADAGPLPTTHRSGGKVSHGRMLPSSNRRLA
jgi:hypothetical protein